MDIKPVIVIAPADSVFEDHSYAISPHFTVEGVKKSVMKVDVSWRNFIDQVFDIRLNDEISQNSRRITTPVGHIMPIGLIPAAGPEVAMGVASEHPARHQSVSRRSPGTAGESGFVCVVNGCLNSKTNSVPAYSSARNWYDHLVSKHGDSYRFIPVQGKAVKNTHDLGERITAAQGHIVCRVKSGCYIDAFNNFTELGRHLRQVHGSELDVQDYNSTWNGKRNGEPLSSLRSDFGIGKRYQTRHGQGFSCSLHVGMNIRQTPEGLADHWLDEHVGFKAICLVKTCISENADTRRTFRHFVDLYHHMENDHSYLIEETSDIDFSPLTDRLKVTLAELGLSEVKQEPE